MFQRKSLAPAVLFAFSCFLHTPSAHADTFGFSFSTPAGASYPLSASGTLTTTEDPANPGVQQITSLTGTLTNGTLTGDASPVTLSLIPVQAGQSAIAPSVQSFYTGIDPTDNQPSTFYLYYDNFVSPDSTLVLDGNGLGVAASDGVSYEIGSTGAGYAYEAFDLSENFDQETLGQNNVPLDITLTPLAAVTPEPTSIALLGTGLLGVAGLVRRRKSTW